MSGLSPLLRLCLVIGGGRGGGVSEAVVRAAVQGGVTMVQLREKCLADREYYRRAKDLSALLEVLGIPFVVDDRVDIAADLPHAGVHLGQGDIPVAAARRILGPGRVVGASASTPEEARRAEAEGADYVGAGPVFPTETKLDAGPAMGVLALREVAAAVGIPVVAIGGISTYNVGCLAACGLAGLAVSSAVAGAPDPRSAARALRAALYFSENT